MTHTAAALVRPSKTDFPWVGTSKNGRVTFPLVSSPNLDFWSVAHGQPGSPLPDESKTVRNQAQLRKTSEQRASEVDQRTRELN